MLAELVPNPKIHGMVVGLLEPDGSRRVIAYGSAGPEGPPLDAESDAGDWLGLQGVRWRAAGRHGPPG